jgi:hypothetical protein
MSATITHAELDVDREVGDVRAELLLDGGTARGSLEVDVRLDDDLLALECGAENVVGELGTGLGHREGSRTGSVLGLDDLVTTELDAVDKSVALGLVVEDRLGNGGLRLGEDGDNGVARVAANDGDGVLLRLGSLADNLRDEGGGTDNVEGGDTEEAGELAEQNSL